MLYVIYKRDHQDLAYRGGQRPIVHLEVDLRETVSWADRHRRRWAFTLSNAGSKYFEDRCDLEQLGEIDWKAVRSRDWSHCMDEKQAEFLIEKSFPWELVRRVDVCSQRTYDQVCGAANAGAHRPRVEIVPGWYY